MDRKRLVLGYQKRRRVLKPGRKSGASGFSLIELLIGIVILAIALALGMPSYRTWIQNTQIRNAAESIQNGMQRARAEAVTRNTNTAFVLGGGQFWTISQVSDGSVIEQRPAGEVSANVTLTASPIAIPPALPPTTITFSSLGSVVANADGTASITQIDIDSSLLTAAESRELRLTVGVGGIIRMCDPNPGVATSDPRHC
jgi:type IV fimbrial biogenesis protein FimT